MNVDYIFNIIIIGDSETGKSALLDRYCRNSFSKNIDSTIGFDLGIKQVQIEDKWVKLRIWDTSGHERYKSLTRNYYRNAHGALIVLDLTKPNNHTGKWLENIKEFAPANIPVVVVGNKLDLVEKKEMLSTHSFITISAKSGENVDKVFITLAKKIIKNYKKYFETRNNTLINPCDIEDEDMRKIRNKCYCF